MAERPIDRRLSIETRARRAPVMKHMDLRRIESLARLADALDHYRVALPAREVECRAAFRVGTEHIARSAADRTVDEAMVAAIRALVAHQRLADLVLLHLFLHFAECHLFAPMAGSS